MTPAPAPDVLPIRLARLGDLARNLWWSWNADAAALFARIDPARFQALESNPVALLADCSRESLARAASDPEYVSELDRVAAAFDRYMTARDTWFERHHPASQLRVAYFCAEYGLTECLPIYSGGLGVLAGDHLKSASDLGIPLVAVGLAYRQGYHRQSIEPDGRPSERFPAYDFARWPMRRVVRADGSPIGVHLEFADRALRVQVWRVDVGRVALYLLDTDLPSNDPRDRAITERLYGGDADMRVRQELVLGIGGVRALRAIGLRPNVFHMNEGHSAFLALERAREVLTTVHGDLRAAIEHTRRANVFTTHTPVPAGNDVFDAPLVEWYLRAFRDGADVPMSALLNLARPPDGASEHRFSMPVLALRTAGSANGVSMRHGEVARAMWHSLWPDRAERDVPIGSITNGVHAPTWLAPATVALLDRAASGATQDPLATRWTAIAAVPHAQLWTLRNTLRANLVDRLRARIGSDAAGFDSSALTLGFARRFATYKRAGLLFRDPERLARLLLDPTRPVQVVIAGKAHPRDEPAKSVLQQIMAFARAPEFAGRVVFVPDYDMAIARDLVAGCDVWLNTPRSPEEASGTSGMKSAMNGGLNLSILDGWWREAFDPTVGWAIGDDADSIDDARDAESLYAALEREVVPRFYARDANGVPCAWCEAVRQSIGRLGATFNSDRMVIEYLERAYLPAHLA